MYTTVKLSYARGKIINGLGMLREEDGRGRREGPAVP